VPGHGAGHQPQRRHHHRRHAAGPVAQGRHRFFSFYLAIPTLVGAGAYSLYKERAMLSAADLPMFGVGLLFSFISAWLCVRWLLRYISTHSFVPFAYYRIAFGVVVLATAWSGLVSWAG
jgi:undecaprenyl-diphosphatase